MKPEIFASYETPKIADLQAELEPRKQDVKKTRTDRPLLEKYQLTDAAFRINRAKSASLEPYWKLGKENQGKWTIEHGVLNYNQRPVVPEKELLRTAIIRETHDKIVTAHPGKKKTLQVLQRGCYWPKMGEDVARYVQNCHTCQRNKRPRDKTPRLLYSLPIPERPWQDVSIDFKDFPKDRKGYDNVLVVIYRLSKRTYTFLYQKTITAKDTAKLYYVHIFRNYGLPNTIVSDRGPQFTSAFWNELCRILKIKQKLSTARHL